MRKNWYVTNFERAQIVALHKYELSQRQISKHFGINKSPVQRTIKKLTTEGIYGNRINSGRPRKTTPRDDNTMRFVGRSSTSSFKKVCGNLLRKATDISVSTISRRLSKEFGLKSYKPGKRKDKIDTANEEERVCQKVSSLDC